MIVILELFAGRVMGVKYSPEEVTNPLVMLALLHAVYDDIILLVVLYRCIIRE